MFQEAYAEAFDAADVAVIAAVDHPERAPEGNRLDVERLVGDLRARGLDARYVPAADAIVSLIAAEAASGAASPGGVA